jgi:DnaJ like chaperone protein
MIIWGKILGGAAGFAIGGPIGALLGAMAGHAVDTMQATGEEARPEGPRDETREIAFTVGVIVLAAKMAKADGTVTGHEVDAFREIVDVPDEEMRNVIRLFDIAKRDSSGFEPYARQIAKLLHQRPAVLEKLLDGLFHIAQSDGALHEAELVYLRAVARIFGFDDAAFERIRRSNGDGGDDPYAILGIGPDADDVALKTAYRRRARENHPDTLIAQGMPPEFVAIATARTARINAAWALIRRERGIP